MMTMNDVDDMPVPLAMCLLCSRLASTSCMSFLPCLISKSSPPCLSSMSCRPCLSSMSCRPCTPILRPLPRAFGVLEQSYLPCVCLVRFSASGLPSADLRCQHFAVCVVYFSSLSSLWCLLTFLFMLSEHVPYLPSYAFSGTSANF